MRVMKCFAVGLVLALAGGSEPVMGRERQGHGASSAHQGTKVVKPQRGRASFYANHFHGRRMANGRRFDRNSNMAASRSLPLGSRAEVRNLENGRTAIVSIQDRGPFTRGRVLDVSPSTATKLGMREQGTAMVEITPLPPRDGAG
jgi:rare lipoprotein A